jgi:hypothetical protein
MKLLIINSISYYMLLLFRQIIFHFDVRGDKHVNVRSLFCFSVFIWNTSFPYFYIWFQTWMWVLHRASKTEGFVVLRTNSWRNMYLISSFLCVNVNAKKDVLSFYKALEHEFKFLPQKPKIICIASCFKRFRCNADISSSKIPLHFAVFEHGHCMRRKPKHAFSFIR